MKNKMIIISLLGIIADRISKILINSGTNYVVIKNFLSIKYARNYGAAWSILSGNRWILVLVTVVALTIIISYIYKSKKIAKLDAIMYGLILGGIIGNFIDRLFLGYVIDFLDFNILGYDFPIFNIADSFIVIGTFIMIITTFFRGDKNESSN